MQQFIARGDSPFPLDMLRYDACWPTRQEDVTTIISTTNPRFYRERGVVGVTLSRWVSGPSDMPTVDRWASFGWAVELALVKTEGYVSKYPIGGRK